MTKKIVKKLPPPPNKKNVLFVVNPNDKQNKVSPRLQISEIVVNSFSEFKDKLDNMRIQQKYDSIVLFPAHGAEKEAKIQWIEGGPLTSLTENIKVALAFTNHVHIVACFSGTFLPGLLEDLKNSTEETNVWKHVTGYNTPIGGERYVSNYIFRCGLWTSNRSYYTHWGLKSICGCRGLLGAWRCISWK